MLTEIHSHEFDNKNTIALLTHIPMPSTKGLPLSVGSRKVIAQLKENAINEILENNKVSHGILRQIVTYFPAAERVGQALGWAAGQTFGAPISNSVISCACRCFFAAVGHKEQRWWERGAAVVSEAGLQLSITPWALPWVTVFTTSAGGLSAVAVACLASKLFNLANEAEPITSMPSLEKLIQWDAEKAAFCDVHGRPFTKEDLEDLFFDARKIELLEKLEQSDVDGACILFNEYFKKIEEKANIDSKTLEDIKKVVGQVCGKGYHSKEIGNRIDFIIKNIEIYDNSLLCHKTQQLFQITKIFDHMQETLTLPDAEAVDKYEYDEHKGKLVLSGGNLYRRYHHITTASTAEAVEKYISKSLADDCNLIDSEIEKLQNVNSQVLEYVDQRIQAVQESYHTFYERIGQSHKGNEIQPKVEQLINDYQVKLTKFRENLQNRLVLSM